MTLDLNTTAERNATELDSVQAGDILNEPAVKPQPSGGPAKKTSPKKKRRRKLSSKLTMWIRRIHLYSGLLMLPWVLLYGFTALLFNHPTYMSDSKTEITHFHLPENAEASNHAEQLATMLVAAATQADAEQPNAENSVNTGKLELSSPINAAFTRQAIATHSDDESTTSVIVDWNTGNGYVRRTEKSSPETKTTGSENPLTKIEQLQDSGLSLSVQSDLLADFQNGMVESETVDSEIAKQLQLRSLPSLEFDAVIDGQVHRLRFQQQRATRTQRPTAAKPEQKDKVETETERSIPKYSGKLTVVGTNPREMSVRNYLLRLHVAHGYPVETNARWFWAIAVDLMFASMCFWGVSGVIMWWQIKKTRILGFAFLVASAIVATWLAIGMHWELTNG